LATTLEERTGRWAPPDAAPEPLLEVAGVTLQYKTRAHLVTATYRVDFKVFSADRFVLLGPSGCGKSTLLKGVAGFMRPVEGTIRLAGREVARPGPDRMMVFQEFDQLLPWKTVLQNVTFPLLTGGAMKRRDAAEQARRYIEKVNLTKFMDAYPHMLSGGMKQRVAIAPGHGDGARHPAHGRAVRCPRRAHQAPHAGGAAAALG
jgi:NitT/TauT family transport system ATP-binding protein